jgi:hypothetical protein
MQTQNFLTPDYKNFDRWVYRKAREAARLNRFGVDQWALTLAKLQAIPVNTIQNYNSNVAQPLTAPISTTPSTTKTALFTPAQANQFATLPFGPTNPQPGSLFRFAFGGLITTPATGTLIIDPYHGPGASTVSFGTDMGASAAQTVTASLSNAMWMMEGYLMYRTISMASTTSTAWLTGAFQSQGTLATAGGGWTIVFGSTAAVSVDTSGLAANLFGALNFAVTFSVTGATIIVEWNCVQQLI